MSVRERPLRPEDPGLQDAWDSPPRRTPYSEQQKAEALVALETCGGNVTEAADLVGVPKDSLYRWSKGFGVSRAVWKKARELRQPMADQLETLAAVCVGVAIESAKDANLAQVALTLRIATQGMQSLRGQATEILEVRPAGYQDLSTALGISPSAEDIINVELPALENGGE